ncbi:MAG: hypothetical protein NTW72_07445 [Gemmatimonadetes bacterium]|nr:hypothetical protein [Gemmatimonadota bacterium]
MASTTAMPQAHSQAGAPLRIQTEAVSTMAAAASGHSQRGSAGLAAAAGGEWSGEVTREDNTPESRGGRRTAARQCRPDDGSPSIVYYY